MYSSVNKLSVQIERISTNKSRSKLEIYEIEIFIAVFFSSMLGAQLLGVSLNKIALIPLELSLLIRHTNSKVKISKIDELLLIWYFFYIVSSIFGFRINTNLEGHESTLILNIIQVALFYVPLLLLIKEVTNLKHILAKAILLVSKIQGLWGVLQFLSWHLLNIDVNQKIFIDTLKGIFGTQWVAWYFDGLTTHLRITGLNHDPAYLVLILILGFCYEKKRYWKVFYFFVAVIASSRSGIICMTLIFLYQSYKRIGLNTIKKKYVIGGIIGIIVAIIGSYFVYAKMPSVRQQIVLTINRFSSISIRADDGSSRHLLYFITAFEIWLLEFGIIGKFFGVGPRTGGVAITMSKDFQRFTLNNAMKTKAWVIECDFAEILLGNGMLGFGLMYVIYYKIFKKACIEEKAAVFGIFIMGFMYDVVNTTLLQFYLICCIGLLYKNRSFYKGIE